MESQTGMVNVGGSVCLKCGKPYVYFGTPVEGMQSLLCSCPDEKEDTHAMGWQCPVCGQVYAPWVSKCFVCVPKTGAASSVNDWDKTMEGVLRLRIDALKILGD